MERRAIDILFLSTFRAPFIQDDIDILSRRYRLKVLTGHGFSHVFRIILAVIKTDIVYCWFGSVYSSVAVRMARIIGCKSVIVLGGVDIAKNRELGYGIWLSWWKSRLVRYAFLHANRMLVSDPSMKKEASRLAGYSGANIFVVPAGFDSGFWKPMGEKELQVLTVAAVSDKVKFRRKGIDLLIEAARQMPATTFVLVGVKSELLLEYNPPGNITFHPLVPREELLALYRKAHVYCQPSREEAFCYTLREAMLCECVPVASEVGGMPTAVSGVGVLIPPSSVEGLVAGILKAMKMGREAGEKSRVRIVSLYPKDKRTAEVCKHIEALAG
jgi:glycosyltransferase involved in cell wall biosynthesis